MNGPAPVLAAAEPLFLDAECGARFCMFHPGAGMRAARGNIVYIHPFAEELNKTRRMAALQSRAFAGLGYNVLQIDLYGCGDSSGDFADASCELWRRDILLACAWLDQRSPAPLHLWGLRLGGLLALDCAPALSARLAGILLWQPYLSGAICINQFLRMALATSMVAGELPPQGPAALRARLAAGEAVEVAGYELSPALVNGIDALDAGGIALPACRIDWFAQRGPAAGRAALARRQLCAGWVERGADVRSHDIEGVPFWATSEIGVCPTLLAASTSACE